MRMLSESRFWKAMSEKTTVKPNPDQVVFLSTGEKMEIYWRNFCIGAVGSLFLFFVLGTVLDKLRNHGDAAGALGELWVYVLAIGIVYSLIMRPWQRVVEHTAVADDETKVANEPKPTKRD